jgi:hypothetical protein
MKKILLSITLALTLQCINAQVLESDNFTALTVGNIGADLTGVAVGQGGWYVYQGLLTDYQVVSRPAPYGNALQLTGEATSSTATTSTRYLNKVDLASNWGTRTAGNNILEVEFDLNTGALSASRNTFQCRLYSNLGLTLAGIFLDKNYATSAAPTVLFPNSLRGLARYTSGTSTGAYSFGLGPDSATPNLVYPNDTWIRVGFSFNQTTGEIKWKGPSLDGFIMGAGTGLVPGEIDFLVTNAAGNTVAASVFIDNYVARASSTDTLLEVETRTRTVAVSTYPNPTVDILNVYNSNNLELTSYKILDLKGTLIKSGVLNNTLDQKINVAELSQGVYMLKLNTTDNATITKKIVKN